MNTQQAIEQLTAQGFEIGKLSTDEFILGTTKPRSVDESGVKGLTGEIFGIYYDNSWWSAVFNNCAISQISHELSVAVQSICDVRDMEMEIFQSTNSSYELLDALIQLQQAGRLPVLMTDRFTLEVYQRPLLPKGLNQRYGNHLSDWWLPDDSESQPIGRIRLQENEWIVHSIVKDTKVTTSTLQDAVKEAFVLFGKHTVNKTSPI